MQAVVEYVSSKGKTPPPYSLELRWQCETYHTLPVAGGILEQPHRLWEDMLIASNIFNAWNGWKKCPVVNQADWIEAHPNYWLIVKDILKMEPDNA